jgi:ketosteroid isomerase-like protein
VNLSDVTAGVQRTLAAYCQALDDGRTEDVVACFCDDAKIDLAGQGVFEGTAAIAEAFAGWTPRVPQRHLVLNTHVVELLEDESKAHVVSDLVFAVKVGDPATWSIQMLGRYDDVLRLEPDTTWRIHRRRASFD